MALDPDKMKFVGALHRIAERELSASFGDDRDQAATNRLYAEFVQAGKPKDLKGWVRGRLSTVFVSVDKGPVWIGGTPQWPFLEGQPMVFLRQFEIGTTAKESQMGLPVRTLYVFAAKATSEYGGWEMRYRVVQDDASFKGLAITPRDLGVVTGADET